MRPQNGLMGDLDSSIDLPQINLPEDQLIEERRAAKFSRTAEFARLKEDLLNKVRYYQTFLPDGRIVGQTGVDLADLGANWVIASTIIAEFQGIIARYEMANEVVKDAAKRSNA